MTDPLSTASVTTITAAVAVFSLCPGVDAAVVIGAFAGAAVCVLTLNHVSRLKRAAFFALSFVNGCLSAPTVAAAMQNLVPGHLPVSLSVGALIAAALSVKVLFGLIRCADHLDQLRSRFKNRPPR